MVGLEVDVLAARNLLQRDKAKKNNCFVQIYLGKQKRKTRTIQASNDPEWKEVFVFEQVKPKDVLDVAVFTDNQIIGIVHIKLCDIFKKKRIDQVYHIPAKVGLACYGQVHLILKATRDEESEDNALYN